MSDDVPVLPAFPENGSDDRRPSVWLGLFKICCGLVVALASAGALIAESYQGAAMGVTGGFFLGLGLRWLFTGTFNLGGSRLPFGRSAAIPVLTMIACGAFAPSVSSRHYRSQEKKIWERAERDVEPSRLRYTYKSKIREPFRRKEYPYQLMLLDARSAGQEKNIRRLRWVIGQIAKQPEQEQVAYQPALAEATGRLKKIYSDALARLGSTPEKTADKKRKPVDDQLRAAFKLILDDLARSPSATVYVAFNNASDLKANPRAEVMLKALRTRQGKGPVIAQGDAFSKTHDSKRRSTFLKAMREAFSKIFGAELLTLKALGAGGERKGQLIFAVGSEVRRSPTYFTLKRKGKLIGYLFGLMVIWDFSVYDRQGKLRYKSPRLFSQPANSIRIQRKVSDPPWAPYSIMMDSAYYNYSRVVIMRFGLTPPAVRQVFSFR